MPTWWSAWRSIQMHNELRVTIVATGIGQGIPAKQASSSREPRESAIPPFKLVQRMGMAATRFLRHDRSGSRQKAVGDGLSEAGGSTPIIWIIWTFPHFCAGKPIEWSAGLWPQCRTATQ